MPVANFEIRLADFDEERFALSVIAAPKLGPGLARKSFAIPKRDLQRLAGPDLSLAVSSKDDALRAPGSTADQSVETFGEQLFDILIWNHKDPELIASWEHFAGLAQPAKRLRLCLANEAPALPWEALRDPYRLNLSLARHFSVVRYIPTSPPLQPVNLATEPLRMLAVFADPEGDLSSQTSALQRERAALQEALQPAIARGELCIDFIEAGTGPTLARLTALAAARPYHILHYFGHGASEGRGRLQFEGAKQGEPAPAGWEDLHSALTPTRSSLRLILLNACELARPGKSQLKYTPFTNLATSFLNAGAAIVVAMQYPIRTETATTFTRSFYEHLGAQRLASATQIEAAVIAGRQAILGRQNAVEWITPVVFTGMPEDAIFRLAEEPRAAGAEARELYERGAWAAAAERVKKILQAEPESGDALRLKKHLLDKAAGLIEQMDPQGGEIVDALE